MYENSGLQSFRTTTGIESGLDAFGKSRFVMAFQSSWEIQKHYTVLDQTQTGKKVKRYLSHQVLFLENNFALSDAEDNTSGPLNRRGTTDLPLFRTLLLIRQKFQKAKFLGSDRVSFISICMFSHFKNHFAMITSLSELYFRFKR